MKKYKLNKGFIVQKTGNQTVIFDADKSLLYSLNETATFIFKKIKQNKQTGEISQLFVNKYRISRAKADNDIALFIKDLIKKKIVLLYK